MLETTTESLTYVLYRYIAVGQYDPAPVNYTRLMFPAILAGIEKTLFGRICGIGTDINGMYCFICKKKKK